VTGRELARELRAVLTGQDLCTPSEQAQCEAEHGDWLEWTCPNCNKIKPESIGLRTQKVIYLHRLQSGGYPFQADDLSEEDWQDLGLAAQIEKAQAAKAQHIQTEILTAMVKAR
jgi:hypothetical protein